jgi:hypothetical protein
MNNGVIPKRRVSPERQSRCPIHGPGRELPPLTPCAHNNYQLSADNGKKLDLRDSYEFLTPEKRITRIEISSDGGQHWTLLSEAVGTKVH